MNPLGRGAIPIILAVHGGAGALGRGRQGRRHAAHRAALATALRAGQALLAGGGSAVDAVIAAVAALEDLPPFNAGHGAVFTAAGTHELDAAVMDGTTGRAGSVAAVTRIRNPVAAAALVMRHSPWVMLCGAGAERFAADHGARMVDPAYFFTRARHEQLERARKGHSIELDHDGAARAQPRDAGDGTVYGTVGAVALDAAGNLAAATSTGGLTNKPPGRIGDSPVIGAGTYADNASVAVSATGVGEVFMRVVAAHDIAALVRYQGRSARAAAEEVILRKIPSAGGRGGAIVLDRRGNLAMVFNTEGMYRGAIRGNGKPEIDI
jgi:L-asparaginase / beta-aspartyl-peptidase